jgi:hypothetical protein
MERALFEAYDVSAIATQAHIDLFRKGVGVPVDVERVAKVSSCRRCWHPTGACVSATSCCFRIGSPLRSRRASSTISPASSSNGKPQTTQPARIALKKTFSIISRDLRSNSASD